MAAGAIADLFVLLSARDMGLIAKFTESGAAGERMAVQIDAGLKTMQESLLRIDAGVREMAASFKLAAGESEASIAALAASEKKLAAETAAASEKTVAANAKVAASSKTAAAESAAAGSKISGSWKMAGLGVAAGVYEMVKSAADFQQSGTRLVTAAGEDTQVLERVVKPGILDISRAYGSSAQEMVKAMYDVNSAGYHGAAGLGVMKAAAQGAVIEQADLKVAAGAVTTVLVDYYPKMKDAGQITKTSADIMAKMIAMTKDGRMTLEDLTRGLHNVAPQAASMGVSFEQLGAITATMTQHGMNVTQATENMNHAFQKFAGDGTQKMRAGLAMLNISWQDIQKTIQDKGIIAGFEQIDAAARQHLGPNGQQVIIQWKDVMRSASPAVQELGTAMAAGAIPAGALTKAINGLDEKDKVTAKNLRTLWDNTHGLGNEQVKGSEIIKTYAGMIASASGDMTTQKVITQVTGEYTDRLNSSYKDIMNTHAGMDGKIEGTKEAMANFNNQVARVKASIVALGISLGTPLLGPLTSIAKATADLINWFSRHEAVAGALAKTLEFVLGAALIGLATKGIKSLTKLALELPKDLAKLTAWALRKMGILATVGTATEAEAATEVAAEERGGARRLAAAIGNGVKWLAVKTAQGVAAAASAVYYAALSYLPWVAAGAKQLASATVDGAKWLAVRIAQGVAAAASAVASAAIAAGAWVAANIAMIVATGGIVLAVAAVVAIGIYLYKHWGDVKRIAGEVWDYVKNKFFEVRDAIVGAVSQLAAAVLGKINDVVNFFRNLPGQIMGAVGNLGNILWGAGQACMMGLYNGFLSVWNQVKGWLSSVGGWIQSLKGPLEKDKTLLTPHGSAIIQGLMDGMKAQMPALKGQLLGITKTLQGVGGSAGLDLNLSTGGFGALGASSGGASAAVGVSAGGGGGGSSITVNVAGHVWTTQDLVRELQTQLLRYGVRNNTAGINYSSAA